MDPNLSLQELKEAFSNMGNIGSEVLLMTEEERQMLDEEVALAMREHGNLYQYSPRTPELNNDAPRSTHSAVMEWRDTHKASDDDDQEQMINPKIKSLQLTPTGAASSLAMRPSPLTSSIAGLGRGREALNPARTVKVGNPILRRPTPQSKSVSFGSPSLLSSALKNPIPNPADGYTVSDLFKEWFGSSSDLCPSAVRNELELWREDNWTHLQGPTTGVSLKMFVLCLAGITSNTIKGQKLALARANLTMCRLTDPSLSVSSLQDEAIEEAAKLFSPDPISGSLAEQIKSIQGAVLSMHEGATEHQNATKIMIDSAARFQQQGKAILNDSANAFQSSSDQLKEALQKHAHLSAATIPGIMTGGSSQPSSIKTTSSTRKEQSVHALKEPEQRASRTSKYKY